jgi:hypothetical protein
MAIAVEQPLFLQRLADKNYFVSDGIHRVQHHSSQACLNKLPSLAPITQKIAFRQPP